MHRAMTLLQPVRKSLCESNMHAPRFVRVVLRVRQIADAKFVGSAVCIRSLLAMWKYPEKVAHLDGNVLGEIKKAVVLSTAWRI